jgi:hypothetical protein
MDCFQQTRVVNFAQAVKIKAASVGGLIKPSAHFAFWHKPAVRGWAEHVRSARVFQTSTCSAMARASSTSMPRYLTVLSILG